MLLGAWSNSKTRVYFSLSKELITYYWSSTLGRKKKKVLTIIEPAAAAGSLQSCPTLCDPIDGSPSSSPVPGILQARILEWVAISFSNACK